MNKDILSDNISLETIESHINEDISFFELTHSDVISKEFILRYKNKPWDFNYYKFLKTLTMKDFLEVQDKIEDFETLSRNPHITLEYILENEDKNWCWYTLSKRKEFTNEIAEKFFYTHLNFYLLLIGDNHIEDTSEFFKLYKDRIKVDFEYYIDRLTIYEKVQEQSSYIKFLEEQI
jgi:hypothetical protein